jgi:hypothetical protein
MVHRPVQHSSFDAHESPGCVQYDGEAQRPLWQYDEQQLPSAVHALPSVEHVALSAVHVPPLEQLPPQHDASVVQGCASEMQPVGPASLVAASLVAASLVAASLAAVSFVGASLVASKIVLRPASPLASTLAAS